MEMTKKSTIFAKEKEHEIVFTMPTINLKGLGIALVTPFKNNKDIDFEALRSVLNHVIDGGADYLVVLGTTGEAVSLTRAERIEVMRFVRDVAAGRLPLIVGMGSNCTHALIEEIQNTDLAGYSAILSVVPYYNKPSQEGMYQHFKAVSEASTLPIILYNVPGRTGVNMSAHTTLRLSLLPNIIGIKEASGNLNQIEDIIRNKQSDFAVISGDDSLTYPLMTLGCEGVISVVGNAFPHAFGKMVKYCLEGSFDKARPIHYSFTRLYAELFTEGNPAGVKSLLHDMGLIENELRLPLVPTSMKTSDEIHKILTELNSASIKG